jgi:hypothetical protein
MNDENKPLWKLMEYELLSGEGAITKWFRKCKKIDGYAELEFETILGILLPLKRELWDLPEYRAKMVNMEGIGEIRFENKQKKQLRIFGMFLEEEMQYVMLIGAVKEGANDYDPNEAKGTAINRQDDVLKGYNAIIEFKNEEDENEEDENEY